MKPGRNEPCPCGSGKKYKNCCAKVAVQALHAREQAVPRALEWLANNHGEALSEVLQAQIDETACACFDGDADAAHKALAALDDAGWRQIQLNFTEWLLAEGDIEVDGFDRRVSELLLGPDGPLLEVSQRAWLEQLAQRPLRLYDITEVEPGTGLTLCDAIDTAALPIAVVERAGSRTLRAGMKIGARLMAVDDGCVLSGALYPFSMLAAAAVHQRLRDLAARPDLHADDAAFECGLTIIEDWLAQYLLPPALPQFVHAGSGEPLLLTTDHYDVLDRDALAAALAAQPDVHRNDDAGWDRLVEGDDGLSRSLASVTQQAGGERVSVFYKTASLAEQGRAWFDALAGAAVKFRLREVTDPKGFLSGRGGRSGASPPPSPTLPEGLDPQALTDAIGKMLTRSYANWADEPIPALDGQTPRQAIATPAGLERVKGLLRSYEDGEAEVAKRQGRGPISYQFLWDALNLRR